MCLTKEQWKKHKEVIKWFYEQPEGTKLWAKSKLCDEWCLTDTPYWYNYHTYIINDEFAELRKAIADGKEIEYLTNDNKWVDLNTKDPSYDFYLTPEHYRIKKEVKFPIYKKNDFMVVKFYDKSVFKIMFIFDKSKLKKWWDTNFISIGVNSAIYSDNCKFIRFDSREWEDVLYDEEKGLWDGQPVFGWDNNDLARCVGFYDAKNKSLFLLDGTRSEEQSNFDNYEPYPHLDDEWIIKAYNKLNFES